MSIHEAIGMNENSDIDGAIETHKRVEARMRIHARIERAIRDMHDGINEYDDQHGDLRNMLALFLEINRTAVETTRYQGLYPEGLSSKICGDCLQMLSLHRRMLDRLKKPCSETQLASGLRKTIDRCIEQLRWPLGRRRKIRLFEHLLSGAAFLCRHFASFIGRKRSVHR